MLPIVIAIVCAAAVLSQFPDNARAETKILPPDLTDALSTISTHPELEGPSPHIIPYREAFFEWETGLEAAVLAAAGRKNEARRLLGPADEVWGYPHSRKVSYTCGNRALYCGPHPTQFHYSALAHLLLEDRLSANIILASLVKTRNWEIRSDPENWQPFQYPTEIAISGLLGRQEDAKSSLRRFEKRPIAARDKIYKLVADGRWKAVGKQFIERREESDATEGIPRPPWLFSSSSLHFSELAMAYCAAGEKAKGLKLLQGARNGLYALRVFYLCGKGLCLISKGSTHLRELETKTREKHIAVASQTLGLASVLCTDPGPCTAELDPVDVAVLTLGKNVSFVGSAKRADGTPCSGVDLLVEDGLGQKISKVLVNEKGQFGYSTSPILAKASIIRLTPEGGVPQSFAFNVVKNSGGVTTTESLLFKELVIRNDGGKTIKVVVTPAAGGSTSVIIPAGEESSVVKVQEQSGGISFPLRPSLHGGVQVSIGALVAGGHLSSVIGTDGKATISASAGGAGLVRGAIYMVGPPDKVLEVVTPGGQNPSRLLGGPDGVNAGACWAPGFDIGITPISASLEILGCLGQDGVSVGGDAGISALTFGLSVQILEFE